MSIEKEREEFEDWLYLGQTEVEPDDLNKSEINLAWLAWKARANLCTKPDLNSDNRKSDETSPTFGMNLWQRITHVGGRENSQGYVEFGSVMAVNALIQHVLRDVTFKPGEKIMTKSNDTNHIPDVGEMGTPSANQQLKKGDMRVIDGILMTCTDPEIGRWQGSAHEPTDTQMLDWLISKNATVKYCPLHPMDDKFLVVNTYDGTLTLASNPREAIAKAMRSEK